MVGCKTWAAGSATTQIIMDCCHHSTSAYRESLYNLCLLRALRRRITVLFALESLITHQLLERLSLRALLRVAFPLLVMVEGAHVPTLADPSLALEVLLWRKLRWMGRYIARIGFIL